MKKPLVIGNWKANPKSEREAKSLVKNIQKNLGRFKAVFGIAVPDVFLSSISKETKKILVGSQNVGTPLRGAYTGSANPEMHKSAGARFTVLGHSEVRGKGETNEAINLKVLSSLEAGLPIVLCIGEKDRDTTGHYLKGIEREVKECLLGVKNEEAHLITLAYEPIWAVGASTSATSEECFEAVIAIRRTLATIFTIDYAKKILVLYGGTVTRENASDFITDGGADGLLVGRASLDAKHFVEIIKAVYAPRN